MQLANVLLRSVVAACLALTTTWSGALGQASAPAKDYEPQVGQGGKDVIWVPTPQGLVDRMMEMAKVTPQDYVIDLGSGDGRTVITAAKLGAKAHGIEYNPDMVELSKRNAAAAGRRRQGHLRQRRHLRERFLAGDGDHHVPALQPQSQAAPHPARHEARHARGIEHVQHGRLGGRPDRGGQGRVHVLLPGVSLDHSGEGGRHLASSAGAS